MEDKFETLKSPNRLKRDTSAVTCKIKGIEKSKSFFIFGYPYPS
jgi:hypothetical protein